MINKVKQIDIRHRLRQIRSVITSQTARNSSVLFIGNTATAVLSVVALIFVSRTLGPEKFGVVATFNAIWLTISSLTDFGLGTSAIKFISSHLDRNKHKAAVYMRVIFQLELFIGVVIAVFGLLFSTQIANMLGGEYLLSAVRFGFVAGLFVSAGAFLGPFLMAFEQFKKLSIINIIGATYRMLGVVLLFSLAALSVENIFWLYTSVPFLIFIIAIFQTPRNYLEPMKLEEQKHAFGDIFNFTKWIFLSTIAAVAFGKLDIFFLSRVKGSTEVGLYAAAIQLTNFFPLIIGAIGGAILPWVSKLRTRSELTKYAKKSTGGVLLICILLIPIFFLSQPIINIVFGDRFNGSIGAFKLIFPGYLINLLTSTLTLIFYAVDKPKIITFINYVQLVIMIVVDLVFIPRIGLYGAALGFLISQIVGSIMIAYFARRTIASAPT